MSPGDTALLNSSPGGYPLRISVPEVILAESSSRKLSLLNLHSGSYLCRISVLLPGISTTVFVILYSTAILGAGLSANLSRGYCPGESRIPWHVVWSIKLDSPGAVCCHCPLLSCFRLDFEIAVFILTVTQSPPSHVVVLWARSGID